MIKTNELRIGDFVSPIANPIQPRRILAINDDEITIRFGAGLRNASDNQQAEFRSEPLRNFTSDEIFPIPITPEILEKCYKNDEHGIHLKNAAYLKIEIGLKQAHLSIPGEDNSQIIYINCEFVHQLQNLYYVLAGEELEVNL